ncbi:MAG TPA: TetR/AcrR family transcriptional regulator [Edaphobacter sp.]|nr:TetR/AcrR family transcriptional regulator [Edaphobacter sp.]
MSASKPRLSSEERKASIVEAAIRLFGEKGFRGTTTREIAAAVGVSEPILYEHFKTKGDLYAAIIDYSSCKGVELLAALAARYQDVDDDEGFFTELGQLVLKWYTHDASFVRLLLFSNLEGHELKDLFFERQSLRVLDIVSGYIERRIRQGAMRKVDPALSARVFLGMVSNYAQYGILFRCGALSESNEEILRGMVGIFLNGTRIQGQQ